MEYAILKSYEAVKPYIHQVTATADKHKNMFGFLADSAYEQMAIKDQLWVAVNESRELKGYLMFGGTMPTLKVFQIYACKTSKGHMLGSKMLSELKKFARQRNYHSISARVAADLDANPFWERNGFAVHQQVSGGKTTNRTINIRGFSLDENDLFGRLQSTDTQIVPNGPVLEKQIYALDVNILIDIIKSRPGYQSSAEVIKHGLQGGITICITPEFKKELHRQSSKFADDLMLRLAQTLPELTTSSETSGIVEHLRKLVFPARAPNRKSFQNDNSDLLHLAYCIAAGAHGFITKERALLRACDTLKEEFGLTILSPDELCGDMDSDEIYTPLNSDFTFGESQDSNEALKFLNSFFAPTEVTSILKPTDIFAPIPKIYEARSNTELIAIHFSRRPTKTNNSGLAALYVDEKAPNAIAVIDHFLETILRIKVAFPYRLDMHIGKNQKITEDTLLKKGFFKSDKSFVKIIINKFPDKKNWEALAKSVRHFSGISLPERFPKTSEMRNTGILLTDSEGRKKTLTLFEFETIISPRFILTDDRDCVLVPIKSNFADSLITNTRNQLSLLHSHEKSLLLEKAYFRSTSKSSIFKKGGIVCFYVSGSRSIQQLIGLARITFSEKISIDKAKIKLDRQGVISHHDLLEISDKNEMVHVFTFDNFLEFDNRIDFSKAKELNLISNANLVAPEKINFDKLKTLIEHAFYD